MQLYIYYAVVEKGEAGSMVVVEERSREIGHRRHLGCGRRTGGDGLGSGGVMYSKATIKNLSPKPMT
jgi:hypothetical protein